MTDVKLEFSDEQYERLLEVSQFKKMTPEEFCRNALIELSSQISKEKFERSKAKVFEEYGEMLKRLADR
jgi:hypothetical protein